MSNRTSKPRSKLTIRKAPESTNIQNEDKILQKKLAKVNELQSGLSILKDRMSNSKKDLIEYFDKNPHLKDTKYAVGDNYIRYIDKKQNDGLSQKLIIKGLSVYFKDHPNAENEIATCLKHILDARNVKIVQYIDISKNRSAISSDMDDEDE